ncbi:MAG: DUF1329 domain-containing protein [Proteobacteria bacterium]|nr:DUF1329 domain-containing protein [Pseudomonadota bacterium]
MAAVSSEEAARLKSELTPMGAERGGNKDGSIPAWSGALPAGNVPAGGRRPDPFAGDKPLYSVTADNVGSHAHKLTEGVRAMLERYPKTFRLDVYKTQRSAVAPQWVYDNTFKNATQARVEGTRIEGAYGGIPFPIPKSGVEAMWNHALNWHGEAWRLDVRGVQITADGKHVPTIQAAGNFQKPYYARNGSLAAFNGTHFLARVVNLGPPIRAGEGIVTRATLDPDKGQTWTYLPGQRRVRKVPNACCDTPMPTSAGVVMSDQVDVFAGRLDRFDWKLVGKKELLVPYNSNRSLVRPQAQALLAHHLNPDDVRWELHRVWVIDATVAAGQRHLAPKRRYYLDEDTWIALLADHWDAKGQLWQTGFAIPVVMPDIPATAPPGLWGVYDLISGEGYVESVLNDAKEQFQPVAPWPDTNFTPDALAGEGVR